MPIAHAKFMLTILITNKKQVYEKTPQELNQLFVDYIAEHLNPTGRAAIIVPEGVVFQSQTAYKNLRRMLVDEGYLYGVISLPSGVFNPYSGVKTSILLIDKTLAKELALLERLKAFLEDGKLAKSFEAADEDEENWSRSYNLLTGKPVIFAANVAEDDLMDDGASNEGVQSVRAFAEKENCHACTNHDTNPQQMEPTIKTWCRHFGLKKI